MPLVTAEFWPGFSECWVFSAGMKIVVENILKLPFGDVFEDFLTRFYELYISIFKAFGVMLLWSPHTSRVETILRSLRLFWLFLPQAIMIRIQPSS
jgi:hypothetical protein